MASASAEARQPLPGSPLSAVDRPGPRSDGDEVDAVGVLHDLSVGLAAAATLEEMYEHALVALERGLGADRAAVLLFDDDGVMRFKAWHALSDGYRRAVEGHSPWARDAGAPEPIFVPDVLEDRALAPFRATIVDEGIRALGFLPLVHRHELLGKFMI